MGKRLFDIRYRIDHAGMAMGSTVIRCPPLSDTPRQPVGVFVIHRRIVHDGLRLPDPADRPVHRLRRFHAQDPGRLQRVQVHRFHHVYNVHHLAGLRAHLFQVSYGYECAYCNN